MNIKDQPALFGRFRAIWTPTVVVASPQGEERYRLEGYIPRNLFQAQIALGLGRIAFMAKRWEEAERWFEYVANRHPDSEVAPEAIYWRAVCQYNREHNPEPLVNVARELQDAHPSSLWATKASVWLG